MVVETQLGEYCDIICPDRVHVYKKNDGREPAQAELYADTFVISERREWIIQLTFPYPPHVLHEVQERIQVALYRGQRFFSIEEAIHQTLRGVDKKDQPSYKNTI